MASAVLPCESFFRRGKFVLSLLLRVLERCLALICRAVLAIFEDALEQSDGGNNR